VLNFLISARCVKRVLKIVLICFSCVVKLCFVGKRIRLCSLLKVIFDHAANFLTNVYAILQHMDQRQKQFFGVTIWSIWKHRNNKVWNNITELVQTICERAGSFLTRWINAQHTWNHTNRHPTSHKDFQWHKPSPVGINVTSMLPFPILWIGLA